MPDSTKKPEVENTSPTPPVTPVPQNGPEASEPETKLETQQTNAATGAGPVPGNDLREWLLQQGVEQYRLPADLKAQILAELPPVEEMERMYRELTENGGLSFEEFCASLGLAGTPKP